MTEVLASMRVAAANGVLVVEDPDTAAQEAVTVTVRHAVDGLVTVSVLESAEAPAGGHEVFAGEMLLAHGRLRVRDVPGDNLLTVGVDPGACPVRITVDDLASARTVHVLVPPL